MPFIESEEGAMMVDWVVLTTAIVGLGLSALGGRSGLSASDVRRTRGESESIRDDA